MVYQNEPRFNGIQYTKFKVKSKAYVINLDKYESIALSTISIENLNTLKYHTIFIKHKLLFVW